MCINRNVTFRLGRHISFSRIAGTFLILAGLCLGQHGRADAQTKSGGSASAAAPSSAASATPDTSGPPGGGGGGGGNGDTQPPGLPPDLGIPGQMGLIPSAANPIAPIAEAGTGTLGNVHVEGGPAGFGIPAHFSVSPNTGSANYSVPIDIPPGVAGMQPKLSLQYNSANGNGQVGVGWSIGGLSEIVRCPQTLATNQVAGGVNDDANDRFCLDGQQLIAVPTTIGGSSIGGYGADGTHYAKEIDDLSEIISHNSEPRVYSPDWFEVHTKSGLTLEYGNTGTSPYSQFAAGTPNGPVVETWSLDKVTDKSSNSMVILYTSNSDVLYPSEIDYSGNANAGTTAGSKVVFGWQSRTDSPISYAAGTSHQTIYRLQSIKTYNANTLVSDYELAYQYGNSTQRSELTTITKLDGASPQNALPPLTFAWSDAQIDVQPDLITSIANGFGASTNISYLPDTSPTVALLGGGGTYPAAPTSPSISVVDQIQHIVPVTSFTSPTVLGDTNATYENNYLYVSPGADLTGRGYLGFGASYAFDGQTGLQDQYFFNETFPLIGDPVFVKKQISDKNGDCIDCYSNTYQTLTTAQGEVFPYVSQIVETRADLGLGNTFNTPNIRAIFPAITSSFSYDTWGNLTQKSETTSDGYSVTTTKTYQGPNTSAWLIDLLYQNSVTAQGINQTGQTRVDSFTYDSYGRIASAVTQPNNNSNVTSTTSYGHDLFGNINSIVVSGSDLSSNVTTGVTYDSLGQFPNKITNALGQIRTLSFDARFGKISSDTDVNNQTTTDVYDTFGRLIKETKPDGSFDSLSYSDCLCVQKTAVEDQNFASDGSTEKAPTQWTNYDAVGRNVFTDTQTFSGVYNRVAYIYDANGNFAKQSNPYIYSTITSAPPLTTNAPDELGRTVQVNHPDGSVDTTNFNGQTITATNGLGQTATIYKDGHGNVSWTQDSLGNKLTFGYDGFDDRTSATDVDRNVTSYTFDIRGRAVAGADPDKGTWTASYNSLNELVATSDAKNQATSISYDLLGRMTQRTEPDLSSNWTYDPQNGVGEIGSETASGVASPSGSASVTGYTKSYSYDGLGRVSQVSTTQMLPWLGNSNQTVAENYTYDAAGRPSTVSTPWDGFTTGYNTYGYEAGVTQTSTGSALWTATGRDAAGALTSATYGSNALQENFSYDANTERMTALAATGNGNTLESMNYQYDVLGNVVGRVTNPTVNEAASLSEYYTYDGLNRLCTVNTVATGANLATATQPCPAQANGYSGVSTTYDSIGDLTSKIGPGTYTSPGTYTYPAAGNPRPHAVQSISSLGSFTYDANGNMLTGNGRTITYTSFNMVNKAVQGINSASFSYDPDHDRVAQMTSNLSTVYLPNMIVTYSGGSSATVHTYFQDADGQKVGEIQRTGVTTTSSGTASTRFFLNDWQNSVSAITDGSGNSLEADSYDAWGKRRNLNGTPDVNDTITSKTPYGYTNQEHLSNVQLIDLNARVYDPYVGVMLSVDPAVANWLDPQTWNAYAYARDNPMAYTDPTGETDAMSAADDESQLATAIYGGISPSLSGGGATSSGPEADLINAQATTVADGGTVKVGGGDTFNGSGGNETLVGPNGAVNAPVGGNTQQADDPDSGGGNGIDSALAHGTLYAVGPEGEPVLRGGGGNSGAGSAAAEKGAPVITSEGQTGAAGNSGSQFKNAPYQKTRNSPGEVNGTNYTGHAFDQMQNRGIPPSAVQNTINTGSPYATRSGTAGLYDPVNNLRVIRNSNGTVMTVIPGAPRGN